VVTLVAVQLILPLKVTEAATVVLQKIGVLETLPLMLVKTSEEAYPEFKAVDTSKPAGAVIVILEDRFEPLTEKD